MKRAMLAAMGVGTFAAAGAAQEAGVSDDPWRTPRELWRPLSADRPDATESPRTVDRGVWQLEMSLAEYTRADGTDATAIAPLNLKLGVRRDTDVQLLLSPYERAAGEAADGLGDVGLRIKHNLWGNDRGRTAGAIMPFVFFPTGTDGVGRDAIEWGVVVPVSADLGGGWTLGGQAQLEWVSAADGQGHDAIFAHTIGVSRGLFEPVSAYAELIGEVPLAGDDGYTPSLSAGLVLELNADTTLDAGAVFGLTDEADDVRLFVGFTRRW